MKTKLTFTQIFIPGVIAALVATIINAVLFLIFRSAGIITDDIFIQPNMPMTIVPIIISSILPTLIATLVYFILERFTNNGFKIFKIIALVLMIITFVNPFVGIPNVTIAYAIALNVMHVTVVGALLYFHGKTVKQTKNA